MGEATRGVSKTASSGSTFEMDLPSIEDHKGQANTGRPPEVPTPSGKKEESVSTYEPSKFSTLLYPINMTPEDFFPECICFSVRKRVGLSLEQVVGSFKKGQKAMFDSIDKGVANKDRDEQLRKLAFGDMADETKEQTSEAAAKAEAAAAGKVAADLLEAGKIGVGATMGDLSSQLASQTRLKLNGTTENTLGNIYLNMPNNVQFSEAANWESTSLGWVGAIKSSAYGAAALGGLLGNAGNIAAAGLGGAVGAIARKVGLSSSNAMIGAMIGGLSQGSKIQSGLESVMSMAQNPYMEMMFQGIGFRKFSFNFIMRPRNADEVGAVAGIIKAFRLYSRPSWVQGTLGQSFMKYPMEFHISFLTMGKGKTTPAKLGGEIADLEETYSINTNIPQFKPCVCTGVETNYTPQSIWAAYDGGVPIAVNLGLTFNETELVMAEDVVNNF